MLMSSLCCNFSSLGDFVSIWVISLCSQCILINVHALFCYDQLLALVISPEKIQSHTTTDYAFRSPSLAGKISQICWGIF